MKKQRYMCQFTLSELTDLRNNLRGETVKAQKLRERLDLMIDHIVRKYPTEVKQ